VWHDHAPSPAAAAGFAGTAAVGAAAGMVLVAAPPVPAAALVGAAGLIGTGALALVRYELVVAIGFALLGVVRVEPAPSDAVLALLVALTIATGRFDLRRVPSSILVLLALLLGLTVLSASAAVDFGGAVQYLSITLYLVVLAIWLATYLDRRSRMRVVVGAYVAGAVAMSALALLALVVPVPAADALVYHGRAQGLLKDPNVFGPFLIPAAVIMLEESLRPRLLGLSRRTSVLLLLVLALGVLFSYSRGAWLNAVVALVVMLAVLFARPGGGRRAAGVLALLGAVAAVATGVLVLTGSTGFLAERARLQAYDSGRFEAQRTGIRLADEHALGVGPGQFELFEQSSAHSLYVRVLAEQGIPGGLVMAGVLLVTLGLAVGNAVAGRNAYGVGSAALLGAWCGLLANSMVVDTLHWRHLWLVAALVWVASVAEGAGSTWYHRPQDTRRAA
jgi:O-antigen ligase